MSRFYGYTFEKDGTYYEPIDLDSNNLDQIAHFICDDRIHDKMITDVLDEVVLTTKGEFIDEVDKSKIDFKSLFPMVLDIQEKAMAEDDIEEEIEDYDKELD